MTMEQPFEDVFPITNRDFLLSCEFINNKWNLSLQCLKINLPVIDEN